ncbi:MAG: 1-acyl-sn-glycerol-3-phosphate acyltransferase [Leptospirales bacterium]|nr:1-acyl-sn-glycerol-3-phosphate acyltransferase [Leptospirales bacterium]
MDAARSREFLHSLLNAVARFRVEGSERVPLAGPLLVICNHSDLIDAALLELYLGRPLLFLAKADLLRPDIRTRLEKVEEEAARAGVPRAAIEFAREAADSAYQFFTEAHLLPIIRGYRGKDSSASVAYYEDLLARISKRLAEGQALVVFPEGSRSPDGQLQNFRSYAARIALRSRAPVLPVAITGAHGFSDLNRWSGGGPPDQTIVVRIGEVLPPQSYPAGEGKEAVRQLRQRMQAAVQQMIVEMSAPQ